METTDKKYNWYLISMYTSDHEVLYLDYFKNKNLHELGKHIKTHVAELYDHLSILAHCNQGGKIMSIIRNIEDGRTDHDKWDITIPNSKKDFDKYVKLISAEINKLSNEEIITEFYGSNEYLLTRLNKLDNDKIFEIFNCQ